MGPGPRGPGNGARRRLRSVRHCFNGAGTARSRKCGMGARGPRRRLQWGRDRAVPDRPSDHSRKCRAAQWGRDRAVPEIRIPDGLHDRNCFNGAGTARSRKLLAMFMSEKLLAVLQWGRGQRVSGMCFMRQIETPLLSMLQWGRDRAVPEMDAPCLDQHRTGFNGAGTARSGNPVCHIRPRRQASMGPGPRGPGNALGPASGALGASMGPGPRGPGNGAETDRGLVESSMGPGPRGPEISASPCHLSPASMGPGPRGPGNSPGREVDAAILPLQWGRDRAVPEIGVRKRGHVSAYGLQWGRDRAVPEMPD